MYEMNDKKKDSQIIQKKASEKKKDTTGIPSQMKMKFEGMTGLSFDDVKVHYNSSKPAQMKALAYTKGSDIYVGAGQEKYLGHELGHVVQQKQGRVKPTESIDGQLVNSDVKLEQEADRIGASAIQMKRASIGNSTSIMQFGGKKGAKKKQETGGGKKKGETTVEDQKKKEDEEIQRLVEAGTKPIPHKESGQKGRFIGSAGKVHIHYFEGDQCHIKYGTSDKTRVDFYEKLAGYTKALDELEANGWRRLEGGKDCEVWLRCCIADCLKEQ